MRTIFKKTVCSLVIVSILTTTIGISFPEQAKAQWAVFDAPNTVQGTITAIGTTANSFSSYSLVLKAYVLDTIATALAKQLIRQLTASVVNWINSGFQGSPSFMTNPSAFFLDVADQFTGAFLAGDVCQDVKQPDGTTKHVCAGGGPLTQLCSSFSIDVRLALAFKYHPKTLQRYTCTLGTIIQNSKNAIKGSSINGFTAGDFRQGGWPAFVSLTTEPQNNAMGAYLTAQDELSIRVAGIQIQQKNELDQGKGFLSFRDPSCVAKANKHTTTARATVAGNTGGGTGFSGSGDGPANEYEAGNVAGGESTLGGPQSINDCPVKTPGDIINSALGNSLNGPLRELELVDSINQVVNALAAQLINKALGGGIGALSGNSPSDPNAYVNQIQAEAQGNNAQLESLRGQLLNNMNSYIQNTVKYKNNKDQSLNTMLGVKNSYDAVKACYADKVANSQPPLTASQTSTAQSRIATIDTTIKTSVSPLASQLLAEAQGADSRLSTLTDIQTKAKAAKTVNDLNIPTQEYTQLVISQSLTSPKDIVDSQQELSQTQSTAAPLSQDASRQLQQCQLFPTTTTTGFGN